MEEWISRVRSRTGVACVTAVMGVIAFAAGALAEAPAASAKPPEVERVIPNAGSTAGGTEVEIRGKVLAPQGPCKFSITEPICPELIVYFGSEPGFIFEASKTTILAFAPTHAAGTIDVTVASPMGTSAINKNDKFTYSGLEPVQLPGEIPVVSAVEPNHGVRGGFTKVTIRGEHLLPDSEGLCIQCAGDVVHFGTKNVAVSQGTPAELVVFAPPHAAGTVDVTVTTNPGGTSTTGPADRYTFE